MLSIKDLSLHDTQPETSKACTGKVLLMDDRISDLPDDILLRIISFLTLKEAGSTSVLSKRWRHVWAYVPHINFDASPIIYEFENVYKLKTKCDVWEEEAKYFRWVDQVVNSHRAHTIDEFRVVFNFQNFRYNNFDNWLRFAMEKRVKRLEFNVGALSMVNTGQRFTYYTLPSLLPWCQLTSLVLAHAEVTGEVLQKFLSGCPNLELLHVSSSYSLADLKIDSLKLKSLRIMRCDIEHLEIYAPNLISFYYYGFKISWPLKDSPNVTELYVGDENGINLLCDFSALSSCMSQLEVFTLEDIGGFKITQVVPKVFPVAPRLKMLHIGYDPKSAEDLFFINYLIKSCPLLHQLELKLFIMHDIRMTEETREAEVFPHTNLKILEIAGFTGFEADLGFAIHLIKTFVSVEKITIKADSHMTPVKEYRLRGYEEAQRLYAVVKPGIDLEILCPSLNSSGS